MLTNDENGGDSVSHVRKGRDKGAQGPSSPLGILRWILGYVEKGLSKGQDMCITKQSMSRRLEVPLPLAHLWCCKVVQISQGVKGKRGSQEFSLLLLEQPGPPGAGVSIL